MTQISSKQTIDELSKLRQENEKLERTRPLPKHLEVFVDGFGKAAGAVVGAAGGAFVGGAVAGRIATSLGAEAQAVEKAKLCGRIALGSAGAIAGARYGGDVAKVTVELFYNNVPIIAELIDDIEHRIKTTAREFEHLLKELQLAYEYLRNGRLKAEKVTEDDYSVPNEMVQRTITILKNVKSLLVAQ